MRTRALISIFLGYLVLAALLALDLVAHSYTAVQGLGLELVRAVIQGVAIAWILRGTYRLFFRNASVVRAGDASEATMWPVTLVKRFTLGLLVTALMGFLPYVFHPSHTKTFEPTTFSSVITIDVFGAIWLTLLIALALGFWQLVFVRQDTRNTRRRFASWSTATTAFSFFTFLIETRTLPNNTISVVIMSSFGVLILLASLLLGYRLPWLPHVPRKGKRQLLSFGVLNVVLAVLAFMMYRLDEETASFFASYSPFWQPILSAMFVTLVIYFGLVFFSSLFSLSSTELVERKSAEVKSLAKLTRFSSDVLSSELLLDLPKLAEQITSLACEATGGDCAWLELRTTRFDAASSMQGEMQVTSHVGIDAADAERIMAYGEGFPEAAKQIGSPRKELETTRRAFVLRKRSAIRRQLSPKATQHGDINSLLIVPLLRRGEVRGGLYVGKHREDGFDDDDVTVIAAFTDVASLALETARLLADSIEKQKFDGELRAARAMQKSLLPERFPSIPGFDIHAVSIPAYDVGGDYYDFSVLWDGSPIIVIGDVSGKGISASLYMAETKGVVQALAPLMSSMVELLEGTNNSLLRNTPAGATFKRSFVTLGVLSFHETQIRYCRAGHTPLLIVRPDGSHEYLQPKGMAVGLMRQTLFNTMIEERSLNVQENDILVLFSDGITDARDAKGEELGYERLAQLVVKYRNERTAQDVTERVLEDVAGYTVDGMYGDDATLVIMRCVKTHSALRHSIREASHEHRVF